MSNIRSQKLYLLLDLKTKNIKKEIDMYYLRDYTLVNIRDEITSACHF